MSPGSRRPPPLPEKGMATPSSILAWRIPWTEESGGLYSPWGGRVRCNSVNNTVTFIRRKRHVGNSKSSYTGHITFFGNLVAKCTQNNRHVLN